MQEWLWASATELGEGIGSGEIDATALTRVYLDAIEAHPLRDRIYARVTPDRAMEEAHAAQRRAELGQRLSLLDGVPISWKDLFDTAGVATEAGTALLAGRVPEADAAVLQNATAAGMVCLGKTHLTEIAFSGLGVNPVTATPPNRNDPEAAPGGSSSGAAASLAFGLASGAIGSDTGGSVRVPAAWNDLVGLKTTHGLLSLEGAVALCPGFDTVGPLARTVTDAAHLNAALGGGSVPDLRGATLEGARFLVLDTIVGEDLEDAPREGFSNAVARLTAAGATVDQASWEPLRDAYDLAMLYAAEAWAEWGDLVEAQGDKMFDQIRIRVAPGAEVSAADYIRAWARLRELRTAYLALTAGYDAVLCAASPILPPNVDRLLSDGAYYKERNLLALRNTRLGNLMGLCSLNLPTGVPSCGILLNAAPMSEARLLRLGVAAEAALG